VSFPSLASLIQAVTTSSTPLHWFLYVALWELPNNLVNYEWGGIAAAKGRKLCKIKLIC